MHLLEEVGKSGEGGVSIGDLAQKLGITPPSVTAAINKLEKKGSVSKNKCSKDGRVVYVSLTRLGIKIDSVHRYFHRQMISNISEELNEEERQYFTKALWGLTNSLKIKAKQFRE